MSKEEQIIALVKERIGEDSVAADTDIFDDLGSVGDDFHQLIEEYARKFEVDMSKYLWYFHCDEEGSNLGGIFFDPPYKRVKRIPITPRILAEYANKKKWEMNYPEPTLPAKRWDIAVSTMVSTIFFATLLIVILRILS